MSSTAIFIRSYSKDLPWLSYCLKSIHKYCTGFSEIIVAVPDTELAQFKHLTAETVIGVHDGKPGYLKQQVDKLAADQHTQADFILHLDSDMCITEPLTPEFFIKDGKPIWIVTPWDAMGPTEKRAWFHVMSKCLQESPPYEFMRKCAIMAPRDLYSKFREFIQHTHGISMDAYVMNQPMHEFSEYNCFGFYLWLHHRERIYWHDTTIDGIPKWPFIQKWSWIEGGVSTCRDELEKITA